jgi:hypothetical protein
VGFIGKNRKVHEITKDNILFYRYGAAPVSNIRYAICVSETGWQIESFPTPSLPVWENDDIKIWEIGLCDKGIRTAL